MSARALLRHPSTPEPGAGLELLAAAEFAQPASVSLSYRLCGDLARLAIPPRAASRRADGLWERTCFEAFVAPAGGERYVELNFAPSTEWAAYAFDGYRLGMRPLELTRPPAIAVEQSRGELRVTADVDLSAFGRAPWPWRVGLAAVVADAAGGRSYWALRHLEPQPDFHDAAGFMLSLEGNPR